MATRPRRETPPRVVPRPDRFLKSVRFARRLNAARRILPRPDRFPKPVRSARPLNVTTSRRDLTTSQDRATPLLHWLLGLTLILVVGALFRLPALDRIPPGFQFDEAYNASDAWRVVQGAREMFFPANGGREPLLSYWQALFLAALGPNLAALRLASAVVGLVTLVVVALAVARLFAARADAGRLGLLTAGVLTVTYWHVHFSRYSIRAILVPLLMTLVCWAFFVGTGPRAPRVLPLFAAGVALAASVYAHPTGRLLPFALLAYTAWLVWTDRRRWVGYALSLAFTGAVSFALFLPLGFFFLSHQWLFWGHPSDVSVFDPSVRQGSVLATLVSQTLAVLGMVFVRGDRSQFHNLPFRPVFDPLLAVFFVLGTVLLVRAAWRARGLARGPYVLALVWLGIAVAPTLFSDAAPNFSRAMGALPVLALAAAAGLNGAAGWLVGRWPTADRRPPTATARSWAFVVLPLVALSVAGVWTARDYFQVWTAQPGLYYAYDADKEDAAGYVHGLGPTTHIYMSPLWATHSTFAFLTRDDAPIAVEMERSMVLPGADDQPAVYVFPAEQERRSRRVGGWLGDAAQREVINDRQGAPLLIVYRVPPAARPQFEGPRVIWTGVAPRETRQVGWQNAPTLVGYGGDARLSPGDRGQFTLTWRAPQPLDKRLTLFAHFVDASGKTVLQDDHEPAYSTDRWQPNEVVFDYIEFKLPNDLPLGDYTLRVGWYDLQTGERRRLSDGGDELVAAQVAVVPEGQR